METFLTRPHNKMNTVFIAGGTGITPYLSLFTDTKFSTYVNPFLYAGFRKEEMNLYKSQINYAYELNKSMAVHYLYQDKDGILDIEKIFYISDKESSFFISGPPGMIKCFEDFLLKKGLKPDQIKTDDWE